MRSIAAVIEVVERAVVGKRSLAIAPIARPSRAREPAARTLWVDIDLDVLQWDNDADWHTRPAVAFRVDKPAP